MKVTLKMRPSRAQVAAAIQAVAKMTFAAPHFGAPQFGGGHGTSSYLLPEDWNDSKGWHGQPEFDLEHAIQACVEDSVPFGWCSAGGNKISFAGDGDGLVVEFVGVRHGFLGSGNGCSDVARALGLGEGQKGKGTAAYPCPVEVLEYQTSTPDVPWYVRGLS